MRLYDVLKLAEPSFDSALAKVHLATHKHTDLMQTYLLGEFDEWQRWQNRRNFQRPLVVALIQDGPRTRWMFAGLYRSVSSKEVAEPWPHYMYDLERVPTCDQWRGRLFVTSIYKERNSYPNGETLADDLTVSKILEEPLSIGEFPGFKHVNISKGELDMLVRSQNSSWQSALKSVSGIYLISDPSNGMLYVGKADGIEAIWGRWCAYAATGHGGNQALRAEFGIEDTGARLQQLRLSILEIADLHATPEDLLNRESHWKNVLGSRVHGYNRN